MSRAFGRSDLVRPGIVRPAIVWGIAVVVVLVMAVLDMPGIAHGYFAAWLVAISLPLGALPLLMALDLLGIEEVEVSGVLRLLLATLPVLALLIVPALFDLGGIYAWAPGSTLASIDAETYEGLAKTWFTPFGFAARALVYLVLWVALSLFFLRPAVSSPRQRTVAGLGLMLHVVIGTLAATDWFMSLDQAFVSSAYGVVVMSTQCAFALAVSVLAALLLDRERAPTRFVALSLLGVAFVALFAQFSHFLVVWSANLPKEIAWYQTRWRDVLAPALVLGAPALSLAAAVTLMPPSLGGRRRSALVGVSALAVLAFLDLVCLVSPRDTFTVAATLLDVAFLVCLAGLAAACAAVLGDRSALGARHG